LLAPLIERNAVKPNQEIVTQRSPSGGKIQGIYATKDQSFLDRISARRRPVPARAKILFKDKSRST
jgi:hypothetical protein